MKELISIIIPCYNAGKTLARTLNSVREQNYKNLEIIIVNDGSTDNTLEVANLYAHLDKRIKIITQDNAGVSVARNNALNVSNGKYIMFLDSDDNYTTSYAISKMYNTLKKTNSDQVICNFTHPCFQRYTKGSTFDFSRDEDFIEFYQDFFLHGVPWNKLTKRECISEYFIPGIKFAEDAIFNLANFHNLKKIVVLDDILYNYYCAPYNPNEPASAVNSMYSSDNFWENKSTIWYMGRNNEVYYQKYLDKYHPELKKYVQYARAFDFFFFDLLVMLKNDVKVEHMSKLCECIFEEDLFKTVLKDKEQYGLKLKTYKKEDVLRFVNLSQRAFKDIKCYNRNLAINLVLFTIFAHCFYEENEKLNTIDILAKVISDYKDGRTAEALYLKTLYESVDIDKTNTGCHMIRFDIYKTKQKREAQLFDGDGVKEN